MVLTLRGQNISKNLRFSNGFDTPGIGNITKNRFYDCFGTLSTEDIKNIRLYSGFDTPSTEHSKRKLRFYKWF